MWSTSESTGAPRSSRSTGSPRSARTWVRRGRASSARNTAADSKGASTAVASTPIFACCSSWPCNAREAINSATVNPMPAAVPAPTTAPQPTGGRPQPAPRQPGDQVRGAGDRDRLADQVADHYAQRDRRAHGLPKDPAGERDPRVGQGEQGDDEVGGPRQPQGGQSVVRRHRGLEAGAGAAGERTGGLLPDRRNSSLACSSVARGAGEA